MIRLLPVATDQTISIIPRDYGVVDDEANLSAYIKEDGTRIEETVTGMTATLNENYVDVTLASSILKEGNSYTVEFTLSGTLLYRDKFYVTAQTDMDIKHTLNTGVYTEDEPTTRDEYTILS
jgi:hypothetical protein